MLHQSPLCSKMTQSFICVIPLLLVPPKRLDRVPCAAQQGLTAYPLFPYTFLHKFKGSSVVMGDFVGWLKGMRLLAS